MKRLLFFVLCLLLISSSCKDEKEQRLRVQNNSDKTIYYDWSSSYPDSSIYFGNPTANSHRCKVNAKSISNSSYLSPNKNYFGSRDMDTMIVFIFDAELIEALSWDSVRSKGLVLKRYFLSLDDLEEMNWIVNYP